MPLTPNAARALRSVADPPLHLDEPDRRYARALAWLGRYATVRFRTGAAVTGVVEGVAVLPHVRLRSMDSGVLLLRRGGAAVDVLEGYVLGTISEITDASGELQADALDRRDRFD